MLITFFEKNIKRLIFDTIISQVYGYFIQKIVILFRVMTLCHDFFPVHLREKQVHLN